MRSPVGHASINMGTHEVQADTIPNKVVKKEHCHDRVGGSAAIFRHTIWGDNKKMRSPDVADSRVQKSRNLDRGAARSSHHDTDADRRRRHSSPSVVRAKFPSSRLDDDTDFEIRRRRCSPSVVSGKFPSGWFDDDTNFERRRRCHSPSVVSAKLDDDIDSEKWRLRRHPSPSVVNVKFRPSWSDSGEQHPRDHYHRSHRDRPVRRENYNFRRDKRDHTVSPRPVETISLRVNGKGEPQGEGETVFSRRLAVVLRKHVPVESMWSSVGDETKYKICQEVQAFFRDGAKVDSSWIKKKARKIHDSAKNRAKSDVWRRHCDLNARHY